MIRLRTPLLAATLLTGAAAAGLAPALAQTTPAPVEKHHHALARLLPGQLVEGRIAFLKTQLKITPAQEAQWQQVAAVMRENAKALDNTIAAARQNRSATGAVQRLESREQFAKMRADADARLLTAFKPLYASLSPEQQQMANRLVAAHHHGWHRRA
ncbi:MAG: Spy/CpxP family protein refolding chaperone [Alphaproteobacteria bacterium]|nr:Spy/CpxP family protein refolding chaperone [Alphaproteobacteria bacterium]